MIKIQRPQCGLWLAKNVARCKNLVQLSLNNVKVDAMDLLKLKFPNLTSLKITSIVSSNIYIYPLIECPKLSQLEFEKGKITLLVNVSKFGITLNHLKNIRLRHFSDDIGKILYALDDTVCNQIQEFTVELMGITNTEKNRLVNIATRFRNLKTLNLIFSHIEKLNTKYLFESCNKLLKLSILYRKNINDWRQMLQYIYKNCESLEVLQLVCGTFDYNHLKEIADTLPKVKLNTIMFDKNYNISKVETFRRIAEKDREKPF